MSRVFTMTWWALCFRGYLTVQEGDCKLARPSSPVIQLNKLGKGTTSVLPTSLVQYARSAGRDYLDPLLFGRRRFDGISCEGECGVFGVDDRTLSGIPMPATSFVLEITAAGPSEESLDSGALWLAAAVLRDAASYILGCIAARVCRLGAVDRGTVAFRIGMGNGDGAVGLAATALRCPAPAPVPANFGTVMDVTSSALESWWRDRPPLTQP